MAVANFNDMQTLATDPVFGNRVLIALVQYCITVVDSEIPSGQMAAQVHALRKNFASNILNNQQIFKPQFVMAAASNQTCANDATTTATIVGLTGAALATQALLCTDAHISAAVAAAFNPCIGGIN